MRSNNLKGHSTINGGDQNYITNANTNKKIIIDKNPSWENYCGGGGGDMLSGFMSASPLPPRAFKCNFCRREFKSAQALGGHMNVHRRERARLRHYSPPPNPNPNHSSSSSPPLKSPSPPPPSPKPHFACNALVSPSPSPSSPSSLWRSNNIAKMKTATFSGGSDNFTREDQDYYNVDGLKESGVSSRNCVSLDLEIGQHGYSKEDLDLELRLGFS